MSESLPKQYKVSRSIPLFKNAIQSVDRHVFGYASKTGFSLNMYGIARQTGAIMGYLFPFSQKDLSEPRLEFVVVHVGTKIL